MDKQSCSVIYASYLTLSVMSLVSKVIKTAPSVLHSHPLEGQYQVLVEVSNVLLFLRVLLPFCPLQLRSQHIGSPAVM